MSVKRKAGIMIDFVMSLLLPILMAYSLIGEEIHEWLGIVMFVLFIIHHIINWHWYKTLVKRPYSPLRIINMIINLLLIIVMITLPISGIIMARYTFNFIHFSSGIAYARIIHLIVSYWGFILMCLHFGLHWNMIIGMVKKIMHIKKSSSLRTWSVRIAAILISSYGIYAFFKRNFSEYMFLKTHFVFFDFEETIVLFLLDYFAIMTLFICIGYCIAKGITKNKLGGK